MIGHLTNKEIEEILKNNFLGRIGCRDGIKPYVLPVNFVYDGKFIIAHSQMGLKINMMRQYPYVCFQIDEIKDYTHWRSVIVWGTYQEMTDERDRSYATKLFSEHRIHMKLNDQSVINENIRPVIYRIVIDEKHGRFETE
jgi:nitroimidazol reductase NimA-like FMN-containing flavoprotein (pyridoxamine 5'-phosphate oxidase superfamily)